VAENNPQQGHYISLSAKQQRFPMIRYYLIQIFIISISFSGFSQEYSKGYIIQIQGDTVHYEILNHQKKRDRKKDYTVITVKNDSNQVRQYFPYEINGYSKNGLSYKSFYALNDEGRRIFFLLN
jgi:hypothetical protein